MASFDLERRPSGPRIAPANDPREAEATRRANEALRPGRPLTPREADAGQADAAQPLVGIPSTKTHLDGGAEAVLSQGFGHDFSHVRIHTDDAAARAVSNIGARAFTIGSDIYFGPGQHHPGSASGMSLLAHEVAHTLQPRFDTAPVVQRQPRDPAETPRRDPDLPYAEEQALLKASVDTAKVGGLKEGSTLGSGHPKAKVLLGGSLLVGPLTSDMGPIYYVYRFRGRDAQNLFLVTRASLVPKNWSAEPTAEEVDQAGGGQVLHVLGSGSRTPVRPTSKQQVWDDEFQREHPTLRDVGRGGDPWGGTDEGEMTETGIRVPRVAGHTLLRRPFYERRMAAFFAYQGFIHYAELIEAGHDAAAQNIAASLYAKTGRQVPTDSEFDLWQYTGWSRRAVASRQGLELGLMVTEIVFAAGRILTIVRSPRTPVSTATPEPLPAGAPRSGPPSPAAVRVQITQRAQQIVTEANAAVDQAVRSGNRAFFEDLGMSESQIRKVLDPTNRLFKAEYGNAMERTTTRAFARDPLLSGPVRHIGSQRGHVAGTGKPDFVIDAGVWGHSQFMDVTTRSARAAHILRDYGKRVLQLVYDIGTFP
ncbi:MAG: DUF4157 domain-containing protein [Arthrobacter sp.]